MTETCDSVMPPAANIPPNSVLDIPLVTADTSIVVPGSVTDTALTAFLFFGNLIISHSQMIVKRDFCDFLKIFFCSSGKKGLQ